MPSSVSSKITLNQQVQSEQQTIQYTFNSVSEIGSIVNTHLKHSVSELGGFEEIGGVPIITSTINTDDVSAKLKKNTLVLNCIVEGYLEMIARGNVEIECLQGQIDVYQIYFTRARFRGWLTKKDGWK